MWNAKPAEGDTIIDGPCGSRFVFRAVPTPTDSNWLADFNVSLGQSSVSDESALRAITEQVRQGSVVGAFSEGDDPASRFYYIGKYEVTVDQYAAVMGQGCPTPSNEGTLPIEKVSLFDAVEFTRRLSEFGFSNPQAKEKLPTASGEPAYIRLPTEAEWEFASRGGASVSVEERLAPTYPMDADPTQFEWFESDDSCRGSLQPVGYLRPNPLGLHDILGNVAEIVSDPFRINRGGRLHGQSGGVTARGGSCATPLNQLRSAARTEFPEFDTATGKANTPAMTGLRLALGAPVIPTNQRLGLLENDWDNLRQLRSSEDDPAAALRRLAAGLQDLATAQSIAREASRFDGEMAKRAEIEAATARSSVANGAMLVRNYRLVMNEIAGREAALPELRKSDANIAKKQEETLQAARTVSKLTRDLYVQSIVSASQSYPDKVLDEALEQVERELRSRYSQSGGSIPIADMACVFVSQAKDFKLNNPPSFDTYMNLLAKGSGQEFSRTCS